MDWHSLDVKEVFKTLSSSTEGLSSKEAAERLSKYGKNELKKKSKVNPLTILLNQFKSFLVLILLAAAGLSYITGETLDAVMIFIIVILNAVLGFVQEYRAEKSIEALRKMITPMARVLRDGMEAELPAAKLVPGDIILIEAGDKLPADARIVECIELQVDESALTGESVPAKKSSEASKKTSNMLFMATVVARGKARAIVVGTGMKTEIGKIAHMVQEQPETETPLQHRLDEFGKKLGAGALFLCGIIFALGVLKGGELVEMFTVAVSLAVAAIPEGLPAIVTITLAIGVQIMARHNSIVRKLSAVESLGSSTYICTDKTGTITRHQMTVRQLYVDGKFIEVEGRGYTPAGRFFEGKNELNGSKLEMLMSAGALCNSSSLHKGEGRWEIIGDPTEGALVVVAEKAGFDRSKLKKAYPQISEIPFESERKMMSTIHRGDKQQLVFSKGAPEVIVRKCSRILEKGKIRRMSVEDKRRILKANGEMAKKALRILAAAYRPISTMKGDLESDLIFLGLFGMIDPPRREAKHAIKLCNTAGINVVMITGDNEMTAEAIGKEVGILGDGRDVMTGDELNRISDEKLTEIVKSIGVFARVNPEHKVKIVKALKANGEVVAMTGDGVNDAPALKAADVGIAMGITGTDVSKEASDMILADDNFATIVAAVQEGRIIFANIKKSIKYLVSCNLGELGTVFGAVVLNLGMPLVPIQILWMNLVTDGLPALALGMEKGEANTMTKKPKDPQKAILSRYTLLDMAGLGLIMTVGALLVFGIEMATTGDLARARTVAFTALVLFQIVNAVSCRSELKSIFSTELFSNKAMIVAIVSSLALHLAVVYLPFLQPIFKTVPLGLIDWGIIFLISIVPFFVLELVKDKYGLPH